MLFDYSIVILFYRYGLCFCRKPASIVMGCAVQSTVEIQWIPSFQIAASSIIITIRVVGVGGMTSHHHVIVHPPFIHQRRSKDCVVWPWSATDRVDVRVQEVPHESTLAPQNRGPGSCHESNNNNYCTTLESSRKFVLWSDRREQRGHQCRGQRIRETGH